MIVLVLAAYAAYLLTDIRPVWKDGRAKLKWPCIILFGAGLAVQALAAFNITVPSPAPPIAGFITNLFNLS